MEYVKKKFVDEENRVISWFSTDDNVLCNDGKTLREKLIELSENVPSGGTVTVEGCNITYISPSSLDEFVELTKEGGLFYSLTSFPIVYNDKTYNDTELSHYNISISPELKEESSTVNDDNI